MKKLTQIWSNTFKELTFKEFLIGLITLPIGIIYILWNHKKFDWSTL